VALGGPDGQKILIVDDDELFLKGLSLAFRGDYDLAIAEDGETALRMLENDGPFAVIVSDMQMPGLSGIDLLRKAATEAPDTVRILLTGYSDEDTAVRGINEGRIFRYLTKPCPVEIMRAAIADAAEEYGLAEERARLEVELENCAYTDELTGIDNRRRFFEKGQEEYARAQRYGRPLTTMMLDLDHFKQVNDSHGHAAGDAVIREVSARIAGRLREQDLFGRYGGEEFSILLIEVGARRAALVANRLCRAIAETPVDTDAGPLDVTISIGISELAGTDTSLAQVLARADAALYDAKVGGRNRVEIAVSNVGKIKA